MRKSRIYSVGLLTLVFLAAIVSEGSSEQTAGERADATAMRVYFMPWGFQTYVPIGVDDIEKASVYEMWLVQRDQFSRTKDHPFVSRVRQLLQSRPTEAKLSDGGIRLKVETGKEIFYADQGGKVLERKSGKMYQLSRDHMGEIERSIEYFAGVIDVRASQRVNLSKSTPAAR